MATVTLTQDNFESVVTENDIVLVDFWAEWCGPCKMFGPAYERVSDEHPDIVFGKVDTEAQREIAGAFGIMSIPTLMVLRDRVVLFQQPGAIPETAVQDLVSQVRELDMDEVHSEIARQKEEVASAQ